MSEVTGVLMGLLLAVGLGAILWQRQKAKAAEAWEGVVLSVSKKTERNRANQFSAEVYLVEVRRSDGRSESIRLDPVAYQMHFGSLSPGDRLVKPAGQFVPAKAPEGP